MVIKNKKVNLITAFMKLGGLLLLPFLLSTVSLDKLEAEHSICLFKNIFGVECYGCGITKAVIACVQCDFIRAFNYNRLIIIVMPLLIYLSIREVIKDVKILGVNIKR